MGQRVVIVVDAPDADRSLSTWREMVASSITVGARLRSDGAHASGTLLVGVGCV